MAYRGGGKPGNKNAEKWTEKEALKLVHDLIKWLEADPDIIEPNKGKPYIRYGACNLYMKDFVCKKMGMSMSTIDLLREKFKSFRDLYARAKDIQEAKVAQLGMCGLLDSGFGGLFLKTHFNYKDRIESSGELDIKGRVTKSVDYSEYSDEDLKRLEEISKKYDTATAQPKRNTKRTRKAKSS